MEFDARDITENKPNCDSYFHIDNNISDNYNGVFLRPQDYIIQLIFLFAFLSLPLRGLIVLRQSTLQGLDRVVWGQLPETVIQPITFIILIALSWKVKELKLSALWAMGLRTISIGITSTEFRKFKHPGEIIQVITELKNYAKNFSKSNYIIDRRRR